MEKCKMIHFIFIIIDSRYIIIPAFLISQSLFLIILFHFFQTFVFFRSARYASFFISQDIIQLPFFTFFKKSFTGIQAVCANTDPKPGEFLPKLFHQPPACLPFTILFFAFFSILIIHKFCLDTDYYLWV